MKFAYCICAHNQFPLLRAQLQLLDDERNDIFVHIDAKAKDADIKALRSCCFRSKLVFLPRENCQWGSYSMIRCELALMRAACQMPHGVIHLLSGVDLPLRPQDEIHAFFNAHPETEFIGVTDGWADTPSIRNRFSKYHCFFELSMYHRAGIWSFAEHVSTALQRRMPVIDRTRAQSVRFYGGANWFSVTQPFAEYVLSQQDWIAKTFRFTANCDEIFMQTLLMNSPFAERRYQPPKCDSQRVDYAACLRKIDWERGNPYVWKAGDEEELLSSGMLFARKFSMTTPEEAAAAANIIQAVSSAQSKSGYTAQSRAPGNRHSAGMYHA